ncbi:unnamed protein product [Colias eurytheme]|nr:unnamed protein product [Colias eurytheme]
MGANVRNNCKFVPPDGGWGYVICIAISIILVVLTGFVNCFGMIYKERFAELNMGSTSVTLLNSLGVMCVAISGFSTGMLLNYLTLRKLGLLAAVLYSAGSFGTAMCNSIAMFFIFQGIVQNLGQGLMLNLSYTVLTQYFVQKRLFVISIAQTIVALATFITPILVKWVLDRYGSLWSLLLLSAVSLHNFVAVILMQPVAWHLKRVQVPENKENELKPFNRDDKHVCSRQVGSASGDSDRLIAQRKNAENSDVERRRNIITHFVDKELYTNFILSNACLGVSLCMFSDIIFLSMLPQALYFMGWNKALVAWALRLFGIGNIITRMLFVLCSKWLSKVGTHEIYVVGTLLACLSRLGMLWSDNRTIMLSFIAIIGISRCSIMVLHPLVIADAMPPEHFTNAMGLSMLSFGIINVILAPTMGAIRELTDSYATVFYILTSCFAIVVIFWTIELVYKKNAHKRQPKRYIPEKLSRSQ